MGHINLTILLAAFLVIRQALAQGSIASSQPAQWDDRKTSPALGLYPRGVPSLLERQRGTMRAKHERGKCVS